MTKRFTTDGYYINDTYHDGRKWLVNEVEAEEIVDVMNGLDIKVRESRKAISKLQKECNGLKRRIEFLEDERLAHLFTIQRLEGIIECCKKMNGDGV